MGHRLRGALLTECFIAQPKEVAVVGTTVDLLVAESESGPAVFRWEMALEPTPAADKPSEPTNANR